MEKQEFVDYYGLLGIEPDATLTQVRASFLRMAKIHHPDVGGSTEKMQELSRAYRTLADEISRKAYDMIHSFNTGEASAAYYRETAPVRPAAVIDDEFIDYYLDSVWAEFSATPKPQGFAQKFKSLFRN